MHGITEREWRQTKWQLAKRLWLLLLLSIVLTNSTGKPLESSLGWSACPPTVIRVGGRREKQRRSGRQANSRCEWPHIQIGAGWRYGRRQWNQTVTRSILLIGVWQLSGWGIGGWGIGGWGIGGWGIGGWGIGGWMVWLPWLEWGGAVLSVSWPWLGQQPELRVVRWALKWLRMGSFWLWGGVVIWQYGSGIVSGENNLGWTTMSLAMMNAETAPPEPQVTVVEEEEQYRVELEGPLHLTVPKGRSFQLRMTILFLRQLESPALRIGSRATRDGRRPFVSQQQLADWFDVKQPEISRWEKYRLDENWSDLLSLNTPLILNWELRKQIVDVLASFPWWGLAKVTEHLQEQGLAVTHSQVQQAAQDVGWQRFKQTLQRFFVVSAESIRPRETGLVQELLAQVDELLEKAVAGAGLPPEQQLEISHLQTIASELDLTPPPPPTAIPWAQKMKWVLFAAETESEEGCICCTYCGSEQVRVKSKQPRQKRYQDEQGAWQNLAVYRYYCDNPDCSYGSFTHFPHGLLPHSPYPLEMRFASIQLVAWCGSTYRRTATALGVKSGRVYLWVKAFGQELLPVAVLFGVVHSSGVVGVDEKWVQVPDKADRGQGASPRGAAKRWMYVYVAVDVYTYDLLHIAIYAHNTKAAARTFLLALKAKGYCPHVIVTDLRIDYGPAIAETFPKASHHECIFHALQWWSKQFKDLYGPDYARTHPPAVQLQEDIQHIFQAKTRRTAQKRYQQVIALRADYVRQTPAAAAIFDSLLRHWPTLNNSIESSIIPSTNNAAEMVIGRFDQLYQNFCGFDSIESARIFLAVFEKVYRFTPFSDDAQPRIRGKSPLELAGYDLPQLAMTHVCRGWTLNLPLDFVPEGVPIM